MTKEFSLAQLSAKELEAVKKAEGQLKAEIGRDLVLIAWNSDAPTASDGPRTSMTL